MLGREIGRRERIDREGREGRRDQGGKRRGHSDRFLVGEEWENQLVPRLLEQTFRYPNVTQKNQVREREKGKQEKKQR